MKKLLIVSCMLLSLAALIPASGCGGSGSSDSLVPETPAVRSAVVISTDVGRAVRVSWQAPAESFIAPNGVVEYQIYRAPVTDDYVPPVEVFNSKVVPATEKPDPPIYSLPGYTLVGTVDAQTTTFIDTTQERTFTYQSVASSKNGNPDQLAASKKTAPGLTPNRYAYDIVYVYQRTPFVDNVTGEILKLYTSKRFPVPIKPVRFQ